MIRKLLLPMLAATALAGCATGYGYRAGGSGDYYYGQPSVQYDYYGAPYGSLGYGYPGGWGGGIGYGYGYPYDPFGHGYYGGYGYGYPFHRRIVVRPHPQPGTGGPRPGGTGPRCAATGEGCDGLRPGDQDSARRREQIPDQPRFAPPERAIMRPPTREPNVRGNDMPRPAMPERARVRSGEHTP